MVACLPYPILGHEAFPEWSPGPALWLVEHWGYIRGSFSPLFPEFLAWALLCSVGPHCSNSTVFFEIGFLFCLFFLLLLYLDARRKISEQILQSKWTFPQTSCKRTSNRRMQPSWFGELVSFSEPSIHSPTPAVHLDKPPPHRHKSARPRLLGQTKQAIVVNDIWT